MYSLRSRVWFLLPALGVYAADVALTLAGQPDDYWEGNYGLAVEANPLAYPFLAHSPWTFITVILGWCIVIAAVILLWRHRAGEWVAVLHTIGHTVGGASWLASPGAVGWVFAVLYLVAAALATTWCWRRACTGPET